LGNRNDNYFHKAISHKLSRKNLNKIHFLEYNSVEEIYDLLQSMDFAVNFRLHAAIISDYLRVPNIVYPYSPKISAYIKKIGERFNNRIVQNLDELNLEDIYTMQQIYREDIRRN